MSKKSKKSKKVPDVIMSQDILELPPHPNIHVEDSECMDLTSRQISPSGYDGRTIEHHSRNPSQASITSQDSCHEDLLPEPQGLMNIVIQPSSGLKRTHSIGRQQMAAYAMKSVPRGLALIIANERYQNNIRDERIGSACDRKNLESLFREMHFEVEVKLDLTKIELIQALQDFAGDQRHINCDMMILVVLSHGRSDGRIDTVEGQSYELESIFEQFNNQQCPYLKGKPKFFIIQACRGSVKDYGTTEAVDRVPLNPSRRSARRTAGDMAGPESLSTPADPSAVGTVLPFRDDLAWQRPTVEDMIIAYSTLPGFTSNRDHELGTWFIQSLVEVFQNHCAEWELVDLLRMTAERLSQFESQDREKQTCTIELRGLYKRLYFNPEPTMYKRRKLGTLTRVDSDDASSSNFSTIDQNEERMKRLSIEKE